MKKHYIILLILIVANISFSQNFNWITPNQVYLKMYVADDGIYRINKTDFNGAGVNPDAIDPRTVKVFYKGNQIPIFFYGEQDGIFHDTDYFDFFGKRNYGGITNTYDSDNNLKYTTDEFFDLFSDTSAYWVGWGGSNGTRYINYNYSSPITYPLDYFYKKMRFEKDTYYSFGEVLNGNDYRYCSNERFLGESWYWMSMGWHNSITQNFTSPCLSNTTQLCMLKLFAYPYSQDTSIPDEHRLAITFNSNRLDTLKRNNFDRFDTTVYFPSSYLNGASNNVGKVTYTPPNGSDVYLNFDMFELYYPRRFDFDSNKVSFSINTTDTTSKVFKLKGYNASNPISIYDVKYGYKISNFSLSADTLVFTGKGDGVFEVLNKSITKKPFRIKQRQVPNLASASNGVDYLVIYNKLFESQAEQLRAYRNSHDSYRSVKAEIEDIYDIFNYGIENPVAIRNFVKYIYDNWQQPKISYICLVGRASLDPKKNSSSSVYYQNYIPVYGNPPTDGYFANVNLGTFTYYHQIAIGRLPAYTVQEAQNMVNKIISYDNQPLDKWIKKTVFATGGYYYSDQQWFNNFVYNYINAHILVPPLSMDVTRIFLNDPSGTVTYNYSDSVKNSIDRGALLVCYFGHSGNHYWDYSFSNPEVLSTSNKNPLVFSMSCFTGENANADYRGYGELFMVQPSKGAIGFISATGWSFLPNGGDVFENYYLYGLANDSSRRIGDIMKYASKTLSHDSSSFTYRSTVNCYNILGDPATKLLLPKYPEFDIQSSDYDISNSYPVIRENISLKIFPKNLGTYADSCKIRFQVLKNNQNHSIKDTIIRNWTFEDTVLYNFKLDSIGIYSMKVTLDIDNWYTQELTTNNSITFPLNVKNTSFVPIKPIDNMIIKRDTVELVGINPNINTSRNTVKLIAQIDTVKTFTSPIAQTHFNNSMLGAATKFKIRIPILDSNIVYYWRLNAIVNNSDTLGWSEIRRFKYNITLPADFSSRKNKVNLTDAMYPQLPGDSNITVYKNKSGQYSDYELSYLNNNAGNLGLISFTGNITACSWGGDPWNPTYFSVNSNAQFITKKDIDYDGIFMAKVSKLNGTVLDTAHIRMSGSSSSDSVLAYLNTFDSTHILIALKLAPQCCPGGNLNLDARNKLRQFGSTKVDSLNFLNWDRWSFISYPNYPNPIVSEAFGNSDWVAITVTMNPVFTYIKGNLYQIFGPAKTWKNFSWQQTLYPGSSVKFDVYGIDRLNNENLIYSNISTNSLVDLQSVNAYTYPYLKLIGKLEIDSIAGRQSPVLNSIKFNYVAPSEIAFDYNTFIKSDSILNGGDSIGISMAYYNVGYVDLYGYTWNIFTYNNNDEKVVLKTGANPATLKIDSVDYIKTSVKLAGLPNIKKYNNYIILYFEVIPLGTQNDLYTYNNVTFTNIVVKGTSQINNLELFSDGMKIGGGEYVRTRPDVEVKFQNKMLTNINMFDTTDFKIFINNIYQPYNSRTANGLRIETGNVNSSVSIKFNPILSDGENTFKLVSRNGSGEDYDTLRYSVLVSNQLMIKDLYNYPNPMKNQTGFIFNLGGNNPPSSCKIKIYTVSGRLVKIINSAVNIGFNQINWDGKDNEGDYMANGVYFYRMIIEGDTRIESAIQKIVILK